MKTRISLAGISAIATLVLAACGGGGGSSGVYDPQAAKDAAKYIGSYQSPCQQEAAPTGLTSKETIDVAPVSDDLRLVRKVAYYGSVDCTASTLIGTLTLPNTIVHIDGQKNISGVDVDRVIREDSSGPISASGSVVSKQGGYFITYTATVGGARQEVRISSISVATQTTVKTLWQLTDSKLYFGIGSLGGDGYPSAVNSAFSFLKVS